MKPMKYKRVFAVLYRRADKPNWPWRDYGGRDTWMAQCEKKQALLAQYPTHSFKVLHEKLIDEKGQVAA